jgi:hypothetical protein
MQRFVLSAALLLAISMQSFPIDGKHVNGINVFAQWYSPFDYNTEWTESYSPKGPILMGTVVNNTVTKWDTLFPQIGQYPAINGSGAKVAFFRWGVAVTYSAANGGRATPVAGSYSNKSYLAVVNVADKAVTNLIEVNLKSDKTNNVEGNDLLDWPAGNWVYYEKPPKTGQVYRINITNPAQNILVGTIGTGTRRWSLNMNGDIAGSQWSICAGPNCANPFPANGKEIHCAGCNGVISASGNVFGWYEGGCHEVLQIKNIGGLNWVTPNPFNSDATNSISQIETQLGTTVSYAKCADLIRWAANSDKWALRQIGWCGQGQDIRKGCNQLLVNYVDGVSILGNPRLPPPSDCTTRPQPRDQWVNACAGDFYITGDQASPNSVAPNSYEDRQGTWHQVIPTSIATEGTTREVLDYAQFIAGPHGITVSFPRPIAFTATVFDCSGKTVAISHGVGHALLSSVRSLRPGTYLVRVNSGSAVMAKRVTLGKG